jgi:hypothetical protein
MAIADQPHINGVAQANAGRIDVDLHGMGLTGFRIKFNIREGRSDNEQRVACLHRLLGGPGSQQIEKSTHAPTSRSDGNSHSRADFIA